MQFLHYMIHIYFRNWTPACLLEPSALYLIVISISLELIPEFPWAAGGVPSLPSCKVCSPLPPCLPLQGASKNLFLFPLAFRSFIYSRWSAACFVKAEPNKCGAAPLNSGSFSSTKEIKSLLKASRTLVQQYTENWVLAFPSRTRADWTASYTTWRSKESSEEFSHAAIFSRRLVKVPMTSRVRTCRHARVVLVDFTTNWHSAPIILSSLGAIVLGISGTRNWCLSVSLSAFFKGVKAPWRIVSVASPTFTGQIWPPGLNSILSVQLSSEVTLLTSFVSVGRSEDTLWGDFAPMLHSWPSLRASTSLQSEDKVDSIRMIECRRNLSWHHTNIYSTTSTCELEKRPKMIAWGHFYRGA